MSLFPSKPKAPPPQANAPIQAEAFPEAESERPTGASSLISTGAQGLSRKPRTQKTSLIGGN